MKKTVPKTAKCNYSSYNDKLNVGILGKIKRTILGKICLAQNIFFTRLDRES